MNETPGERNRSDETADRPSISAKRPSASKKARKTPTATKSKGRADSSKKSMAARAAAEAPPESKTPATEKPVQLSPPKKTSQYLVTIDNSTGLPTKIEKLDTDTGEKKELSQAEYLQLGSAYTNPYTKPLASGFTNYLETPGTSEDLSLAYYRGVMDYLRALKLY